MALAVYKSENEGNLILDLRYIKKGVYYQQSGYPVEFSLTKGTVNGSGANIYIEEVLKFDDLFLVFPRRIISLNGTHGWADRMIL
jgi:hypothetical protein